MFFLIKFVTGVLFVSLVILPQLQANVLRYDRYLDNSVDANTTNLTLHNITNWKSSKRAVCLKICSENEQCNGVIWKNNDCYTISGDYSEVKETGSIFYKRVSGSDFATTNVNPCVMVGGKCLPEKLSSTGELKCSSCNPYCTVQSSESAKLMKLEYFDNALYYVHPKGPLVMWTQAVNYCVDWFGANLTSIHSEQEFNFIRDISKRVKGNPDRILIGGKRLAEGGFGWIDGSPMTEDYPLPWYGPNPDNLAENVMEIAISANGLNDVKSSVLRGSFVCRKPCV